METTVVAIFVVVYLGMALGRLPGLVLDRTGVALLGAIALVASGAIDHERAWAAVDLPTIHLLFALMVISAQFRMAGFYTEVVRRIVDARTSPPGLLAIVIGVSGSLSALLTNDVVCLAMTPILIEGCTRRKLDPVPYLLGLACASNVGSAATLIGNPQNILIGETLDLSFGQFVLDAGVPSLLGLVVIWLVLERQYRGRWQRGLEGTDVHAPPLNRWQSSKGIVVVAALVFVFVFLRDIPRDGVALVGAAFLLVSRRMATREILSLVDWQLLVLFISLFIVNDAVVQTGVLVEAADWLHGVGIDPGRGPWLFGLSAVLSNVVSNVPATMLLLPAAQDPLAGPILALSSTFAGNLIIVGSVANIIVVSTARQLGIEIGFRTHAKTGIPVTLVTLALGAGWLWLRAGFA